MVTLDHLHFWGGKNLSKRGLVLQPKISAKLPKRWKLTTVNYSETKHRKGPPNPSISAPASGPPSMGLQLTMDPKTHSSWQVNNAVIESFWRGLDYSWFMGMKLRKEAIDHLILDFPPVVVFIPIRSKVSWWKSKKLFFWAIETKTQRWCCMLELVGAD